MFGLTKISGRNSLRRFRRRIWGHFCPENKFFSTHTQFFDKIFPSIQIFYGLIFYICLSYQVSQLSVGDYAAMNPPLAFKFIKLLPLNWLEFFLNLIPIFVLPAFFRPQIWWFRLLAATGFLFGFAYRCSFGVNYHAEMQMAWGSIACSFFRRSL